LSSTNSNGKAVTNAYDISGNKIQTTYPEGSVVNYVYDTAGRLSTITSDGSRGYTYTYDTLSRRTRFAFPNGVSTNYAYDAAGRMTNLDHKASNGKIIASFAYTLDKIGNRLSKAEPDGKTNYSYNTIHRLLLAQLAQPHGRDTKYDENYSYDPTGNRLHGPWKKATYTYGAANELLKKGQIEFSYDKNGNLIGKNLMKHGDEHACDKDEHSDNDGRRWTYTYDYEDRLVKAETKYDNESTIVSFKYDPFGRRIEKSVSRREHGKTEENKVHTYLYSGQAIVLEYQTRLDNEHKKTTETTTTKYVHGPNIDEPLAMTRGDKVLYYHADGLGSIVALTDKNQKIYETYKYDSFGNLKARDSSPAQPFTYTGREWDKETGLYYYRARYYDPMEGRFISKDPISFKGGDVNLYGYTGNNPINFTDPSGLRASIDPGQSGDSGTTPASYLWDPNDNGSLTNAYCTVASKVISICLDRASVEAALTKSLPGMAIYGLSIANGAVSMTICPGGVSPSTATTVTGFMTKPKWFGPVNAVVDAVLTALGH